MTVKNFYETLGISRQATQKEIDQHFRELARTRHPDRFEGEEKERAEKEFQNFTEAYNVLRDSRRRAEHDLDLDRPSQKKTNDPGQAAEVFMKRGIRAYKLTKYIEAADNFSRATEADPKNHQAWHHLALTCLQEDRWLTKAQEAIERAIDLKAHHQPYVKLAGRIFLKSGVTARAREYYNQLLELGGSDATVRKALEVKGALPSRGSRSATAPADEGAQKEQKTGLFRKLF